MALTPFERSRGLNHGRLLRDTATDGDAVFQLGDDNIGADGNFDIGDEISLSRSFTLDSAASTVLRFSLRVLPPIELPVGFRWRLRALYNAVVVFERLIEANANAETIVFPSIPISTVDTNYPGADSIEFQLTVVA